MNLLPNRAGMVCFNVVGHVLVVSAMGKTDSWVFPKGHIEALERGYETAEREVWEEAGIKARVVNTATPLGQTEFLQTVKDKTYEITEQVVTEWWVGAGLYRATLDPHHADGYKETDFRVIKWLPWRTALEVLSFPDQREMLRRALCLPEGDNGVITKTLEQELANF